MLGLLTHLAVLRTAQPSASEGQVSDPRPAEDDDQDNAALTVLAAARQADEAYRREHCTGITRDALRRELRVSTEKASAVLRILRDTSQRAERPDQ